MDKYQDDCDIHIPLMGYRRALHETMGRTPAKVIFDSDHLLPAGRAKRDTFPCETGNLKYESQDEGQV